MRREFCRGERLQDAPPDLKRKLRRIPAPHVPHDLARDRLVELRVRRGIRCADCAKHKTPCNVSWQQTCLLHHVRSAMDFVAHHEAHCALVVEFVPLVRRVRRASCVGGGVLLHRQAGLCFQHTALVGVQIHRIRTGGPRSRSTEHIAGEFRVLVRKKLCCWGAITEVQKHDGAEQCPHVCVPVLGRMLFSTAQHDQAAHVFLVHRRPLVPSCSWRRRRERGAR